MLSLIATNTLNVDLFISSSGVTIPALGSLDLVTVGGMQWHEALSDQQIQVWATSGSITLSDDSNNPYGPGYTALSPTSPGGREFKRSEVSGSVTYTNDRFVNRMTHTFSATEGNYLLRWGMNYRSQYLARDIGVQIVISSSIEEVAVFEDNYSGNYGYYGGWDSGVGEKNLMLSGGVQYTITMKVRRATLLNNKWEFSIKNSFIVSEKIG